MDRIENPELARRILNHLADRYKIKETREPNHLSSFVYCRTKGFFDQKQAIEPTDEEVMLFALGYGLQDVLTPKDADTPTYEKDGVIYRPDMSFFRFGAEELGEIKTTRRSAKRHWEEVTITWMDYMMGGCYMRGTNRYDLVVLYMMGNYSPPFPTIMCDTFIFTDDELAKNWQMILEHKAAADLALKTGEPPYPFQHCYNWECNYCRYKMVCEVLAREMAEKDIDEFWPKIAPLAGGEDE